MNLTMLAFMAIIKGHQGPYNILNSADLWLEIEEQKTAAMSSGYTSYLKWQSFNEWRCFTTNQATVEILQVRYGGRIKNIPSIRVFDILQSREFTVGPEYLVNYDDISHQWSKALSEENEICLLAAKLPESNHSTANELWYVSKLKTNSLLWTDEELIDWE